MPEEKLTILDIIKGIFGFAAIVVVAIVLFGLVVIPIFLLFIIFILESDLYVPVKAFLATFAFVFFIILYGLIKIFIYIFYKSFYRSISKGKNKNMIGDSSISIDEDYIIENINGNVNKYLWNNIEKVISTDRYMFIYTASMSAIVIPLFKLDNEISNNFKNLVLDKCNSINLIHSEFGTASNSK